MGLPGPAVLIYLLAFCVGAVAEYLSDLLTIRWNAKTSARSFPLSRPRMKRHVGRTILIGWALLTVSAVDVMAVLGGADLLVAVLGGSYVGSAVATWQESWRKWENKTKGLREDEEE